MRFKKEFIISIGKGKIIVEFFSADMWVKVCKYLNCKAAGDSEIISEASFKALEAFCSPEKETIVNKYSKQKL